MQTYCDAILLIPQLSIHSTKQLATDIGTVTASSFCFLQNRHAFPQLSCTESPVLAPQII